MADASYQPKVYKAQGGAELVITSSGTLTMDSGARVRFPFTTVSSSATTIPASGISHIAGTTVGPTYLIQNPVIGNMAWLVLDPSSSGATHRAIITGGTTDITFRLIDAYNKITLTTFALRAIGLVGITTGAYKIVATHTTTMVAGLGTS